MPQGFARGLGGICHARSSSASFQVSWLRDTFPIPMLLALNNLTNIADERFFAFHVPGTERFSLRLARARVGDSGFYECQVATREGEAPLFRLIYLDVVREFTLLSFVPDASRACSPCNVLPSTNAETGKTCAISIAISTFSLRAPASLPLFLLSAKLAKASTYLSI